jgi:hypothetical protein
MLYVVLSALYVLAAFLFCVALGSAASGFVPRRSKQFGDPAKARRCQGLVLDSIRNSEQHGPTPGRSIQPTGSSTPRLNVFVKAVARRARRCAGKPAEAESD